MAALKAVVFLAHPRNALEAANAPRQLATFMPAATAQVADRGRNAEGVRNDEMTWDGQKGDNPTT